MTKSFEPKPLIKTILYLLGISLFLGGIASLVFADRYFYISLAAIVLGICLFAVIPLTKASK